MEINSIVPENDPLFTFEDKNEKHLASVELRKHFGKYVRQYRTMMKISQEELADILGITPTFMGLVERGQRGMDIILCRKFSILTGISLNDLFAVPSLGKSSSDKDILSEGNVQILLDQIRVLIINSDEETKSTLAYLIGCLVLDNKLGDAFTKFFQALIAIFRRQT